MLCHLQRVVYHLLVSSLLHQRADLCEFGLVRIVYIYCSVGIPHFEVDRAKVRVVPRQMHINGEGPSLGFTVIVLISAESVL